MNDHEHDRIRGFIFRKIIGPVRGQELDVYTNNQGGPKLTEELL